MRQDSDSWDPYAKEYDQKVFSLTRFAVRRHQVISRIQPGRTLNAGSGPTPHLNRDLVNRGHRITCVDFSPAMVEAARQGFSHPLLNYQFADMRYLPFGSGHFDTVISVNSILPPERKQVTEILNEINRVLRPGGVLVAFLCSFDSAQRASQKLGLNLNLDSKANRVCDTTGWQCFHTPKTIKQEMYIAGFHSYSLKKVLLRTKEEIAEFKRIYGVDTSRCPIYEYLITAPKGKEDGALLPFSRHRTPG